MYLPFCLLSCSCRMPCDELSWASELHLPSTMPHCVYGSYVCLLQHHSIHATSYMHHSKNPCILQTLGLGGHINYKGLIVRYTIQVYYITHRPAGSRKHHRIGDSTRKVFSNSESEVIDIVIVFSHLPPVWTVLHSVCFIELPQAEDESIITCIETNILFLTTDRIFFTHTLMCWVDVCKDLNFQDKV